MSGKASANVYCDHGRHATSTRALLARPVSGSKYSMASPAQSTSIFSPRLQPTRMVNAFASAHLRWSWQKAEYWYGSPPEATASSQYSFQHSVSVMPRRISSVSTFPWSIGNFADRDCALGYSLARIAALSISSGSGHSSPTPSRASRPPARSMPRSRKSGLCSAGSPPSPSSAGSLCT